MLPLAHPQMGTWTGKQVSDLSGCKLMLHSLSHTSQGPNSLLKGKNSRLDGFTDFSKVTQEDKIQFRNDISVPDSSLHSILDSSQRRPNYIFCFFSVLQSVAENTTKNIKTTSPIGNEQFSMGPSLQVMIPSIPWVCLSHRRTLGVG